MSFSDVRYEQNFQNDYTSFSVGPFVNATISDNLSVDAQVGGYFSDYARGGLNGDSENISSYYGSAGVNQRINDVISESLTAGREFLPGLTSNFTDRIYANYTDAWQATSLINIGANLWWENLDDSDAFSREESNRYGFGLNLVDNVTKNATLNLNYQYILKVANPNALSYYQNAVTIGFRYQF
jgi:opacity protein-like surface antigen